MSLDNEMQGLLSSVNGAVGAAVVDLSSGLLLSVKHSVPYFTQSYLDAVAAAAVDMFRGNNISNVEEMLSSTRGQTVRNSIKEVQMTTDGTFHFMSIVPGKEDSLLVLITTKKANLGMGWAAVRKALGKIAPFCPG